MKERADLEKALKKISQSYPFDGSHLELSTDARNDALVAFIVKHFFPDEPLSKSIGLVDDINESDMNILETDIKTFMLADNLSVLLVSDSTDEIIGARIIMMMRKTDEDTTDMLTNETFKITEKFVKLKDREMDVFKHYGVDLAVHFVALAVHRDFRKRGYASKLMQAAIDFSKELCIDNVCIKGEGTSNFTQRIYEKCGFETLHEMVYDEYKIDGKVVFDKTGEHKSVKIYVKQY